MQKVISALSLNGYYQHYTIEQTKYECITKTKGTRFPDFGQPCSNLIIRWPCLEQDVRG